MPTRLSVAEGSIRFDGTTAADWQPVSIDGTGDLSGLWSDTSHWSTGAVPDAATPVVISDDGAATATWEVFATGSNSAASLSLDMHLGLLSLGSYDAGSGLWVTGSISVTGALTEAQGTLLAEPGALLSVGAFEQTGGNLTLADDGTGTTTLESAGSDTVNGEITLNNAAQWLDAALGIGVSNGPSAEAAVTLDGGGYGATINVLGTLQVGADPTTLGGVGTLSLLGSSVVSAAELSVFDGSVVEVDASSGVAVGASGTAQAGAITVAADGSVLADIATLGGDVVNDGSFAVEGWSGGTLAAPGDVLVTGSLLSDGGVSVAAAATLTVQSGVTLSGGSLAVGAGGTLAAGGATSTGIDLEGGQLTLDGGLLQSLGTADFANSNATLTAGAVWSTATLSIAPGTVGGSAEATATVSLSGAATLADAGGLDIGNDPTTGSTGGLGALLLSVSSTATAGSLAVVNGSTLAVDTTSSVVLGSAAAAAGTVAIGAGSLLFADIATIIGNIDDAGTLDVAAWVDGSAGSVLVGGSLTGAGTATVDGTLELGSATGFAGQISISGGGTLILDAGGMAGGVVAANAATATIEVLGQAFDSAGFAPTYDSGTGLLVFGDAAGQSTLDVGAGLSLDDLTLASLGGGTEITEAPCYVAGTLIRTGWRLVPVESLRPGDRVRTLDGSLAPVVWVGRREIDLKRHPQPWRAAPIRIMANAFAPGVPSRHLFVSPDHALFIDGRLVPVARLANGATIARQDDDVVVTYVHVELDRHAVIFAEDCPAESYLDTGNRGLFANASGPHPLHPHLSRAPDPAALAIWAEHAAAPLLTAGDELAALRVGLAARAVALGWEPTVAVRPTVLMEGTPLVVRPAGVGAWRVRLHPDTQRLHLCSASFVPAEMRPDSSDTRRLGLAVQALRVEGEPLPASAYGAGWHAPEDGFRWTSGAGELHLPRPGRRVTLDVVTVPAGQYWRPPRRHRAGKPPKAA